MKGRIIVTGATGSMGAAAVEAPDGTVTYSQLPPRLFTREIPLKPINKE